MTKTKDTTPAANEFDDITDEEVEMAWYESTFSDSGSPTFQDYVRAHLIPQTVKLPEDDLMDVEQDKILAIHLDDQHVVMFTHQTMVVQEGVEAMAVSSFLYDNPGAQGGPIANMITYILAAPSGNEADVFAAIDCDWVDIGDALFLPFQDYPAAFTRMFAMGMVGYTSLVSRSDISTSYKLKLHEVVLDGILPAVGAKPFVMFYENTPPGYNLPLDCMAADLERLPLSEQAKAMSLLSQRYLDEDQYVTWLREKLNAAPIMDTLVSMTVLDEKVYSEEVLFEFDMESGAFTLSIEEPREDHINYDDYASGNFEPIASR